MKVIKNFAYGQVYCRKCGDKTQYLLEISRDVQRDIYYWLPCIKKAFEQAQKNDKDHVK